MDLPRTTISSLTKWSSSTYQDFCQAKFTESLLETDLIFPNDIFYLATVTRDSGKSVQFLHSQLHVYVLANLQAFVVIKNDYPVAPPIFSLSLNYKGAKNSQNDDNIRVSFDVSSLTDCKFCF